MSVVPPSRTLREHPDLEQLKRQAKELLDGFRAGDGQAVAEVRAHYDGADSQTFALHDAQLALARAYGFDSWPKLKAYVEGVTVSRLIDAVRAGEVDRAREMLDRRPELVSTEAIQRAAMTRSAEMVRLLMEHGADARQGIWPHRDATSALTVATERGYDDIVEIIRREEERREASRRPDPIEAPALHRLFEAAAEGETQALAILQANQAVIHERGPNGWTPLHLAAGFLYEDMIVWLIDHGADVNARNNGGNLPLDVRGSRCRWADYDQELEKRVARAGRLLVERGSELNVCGAVTLGYTDWLRDHYARGDCRPGDEVLVTYAVLWGGADVLKVLLEAGLDPDGRTQLDVPDQVIYSWGEPLRQCAILRKHSMAEMLLAHGADPNTNVYAASDAISIAYEANDREMVQLLERYGGTVNAGLAGRFGLVEKARQMLADEAAGLLAEREISWPGPPVAAALVCAGADGAQPDIVRLALGHLDWKPGDSVWHQYLFRSLAGRSEQERERSFACFKLMLERSGPHVFAPDGRSILHDVAAAWPTDTPGTTPERVVLATMLLDAGARLDVRDEFLRSTPLGWACRWGRTELVKLLLERGADPVEADAEPWATPLAWAEKMKHDEVAAILREYGQHHS
jgi:ankyrin repeat protein